MIVSELLAFLQRSISVSFILHIRWKEEKWERIIRCALKNLEFLKLVKFDATRREFILKPYNQIMLMYDNVNDNIISEQPLGNSSSCRIELITVVYDK